MAEEMTENAVPKSAAAVEKKQVKVSVGDIVHVYAKIKEGGKERIQVFKGTVISKRGVGPAAMFTVRRVSHGVGVERVFPVNSPTIASIEVENSQRVRRAKLYHVRRNISRKIKV